MIQIAIVEDEEIYVKQLTEYIRKYQTERGRSIKLRYLVMEKISLKITVAVLTLF